jgi:hypothetical protein
VTISDLDKYYDVSQNPDVVLDKKSKEEALLEFITSWEGGQKESIVTREQFQEYYADVSAAVEREQQFADIINKGWKLITSEM